MIKLTQKQENFCLAYAEFGNASEAFRRAYPHSAKWRSNAVHVRASQLLKLDKVQLRLKELRAPALEKCEVTVERVVKELARVAFGDKRELVSWGPAGLVLRESEKLSDDAAAMVSEISETRSETQITTRLKTSDKVKALELLGRHLAMFTDKKEVTGKDGAGIILETVIRDE